MSASSANRYRLQGFEPLDRTSRCRPLPYPAIKRFEGQVRTLREALNDVSIPVEAAQVIGELIESVTIHPDGERGPEAEVVAKLSDLVGFATNDNAAREGGVWCSILLVAGTGFEPVTFRL